MSRQIKKAIKTPVDYIIRIKIYSEKEVGEAFAQYWDT